ncbi:MAG: hypothetical protein HY046_03985, partial [Acidobacteria bacterium]|nr:hypothetical protein [Acidobacteriota bacterium]
MKRMMMCLCILLIVPAAIMAQEPAKDETAAKLKLLEERLQAVEAELAALKAAKLAEAPVAQPAQPVAMAAPAIAAGPQTGVSLGGNPGAAKALNPDISLIGNFLGAFGKNPISPVPGLEMRESELSLQAIIDPYARADVYISFGETGVNVEEAFLTFTSLPGGFVAKAGKMRSAFGKVNTLHSHTLEWTDRPLVTENLIGGEDGINDAGFSVTRILPAPKGIFLEGTAQVFRGDSADVFKTTRHGDRSVVGHLRGYGDLSESTNLDLGFSYARGYNDAAPGFITQLYGMDATLRWKPLRRAIYHSFLFRTEAVWSDRE